MDLASQIIAYEDGQLDDAETIALFSRLIQNGMAWQLQGSYDRQAAAFIEAGILDAHGNILKTQ